jgi:hypothetical protein
MLLVSVIFVLVITGLRNSCWFHPYITVRSLTSHISVNHPEITVDLSAFLTCLHFFRSQYLKIVVFRISKTFVDAWTSWVLRIERMYDLQLHGD